MWSKARGAKQGVGCCGRSDNKYRQGYIASAGRGSQLAEADHCSIGKQGAGGRDARRQ